MRKLPGDYSKNIWKCDKTNQRSVCLQTPGRQSRNFDGWIFSRSLCLRWAVVGLANGNEDGKAGGDDDNNDVCGVGGVWWWRKRETTKILGLFRNSILVRRPRELNMLRGSPRIARDHYAAPCNFTPRCTYFLYRAVKNSKSPIFNSRYQFQTPLIRPRQAAQK